MNIQHLKRTIKKLEESRGKYNKCIEMSPFIERIIEGIKNKMRIIKDSLCINYQTENLGKTMTFFPLFGLDVDQATRNNSLGRINMSFDIKEPIVKRKGSLDAISSAVELPGDGFLSPGISRRKMLDIEPKVNLLKAEPLNECNISGHSNKSELNESNPSNFSNMVPMVDERVDLVIREHLSKSLIIQSFKPFDKTIEEEQIESIYKGLTKPVVRRYSFSEESIKMDDYEDYKRLNNSCTLDYSLQPYNYKKSKLQRSQSLIQLQRPVDDNISISFTKR